MHSSHQQHVVFGAAHFKYHLYKIFSEGVSAKQLEMSEEHGRVENVDVWIEFAKQELNDRGQ